jgi:3-oxoacyl-[acyl-carrier protein] reductase
VKKLDGKVALVSGSGRGIGRAIALKLAGEGARVVINDLDEAPAAETLAAIQADGGQAACCLGDVTAEGFPERFVGMAIETFGGLDIIVNNAGYTWDNVIQKMSDEQWRAVMEVHTTAPFRILRAASEHIRAAAKAETAEGRRVHRKVVNISSISGLYGNAGQANYAAAKAAMVGLTRALCKEWGRYSVNVNCVAFGLIETRMTKALGEEGGDHVKVGEHEIATGIRPETLAAIRNLTPLGRAGTPEDAAGAVYLLCLPEADFISGQVLVAAGGLLI